MAKRGDAAREAVKDKIIAAFGDDFIAYIDKKIYVEMPDGPGGEVLQFAITMTMPKATVARAEEVGEWNGPAAASIAPPPTEISDDDKAKVAELMRSLGLSDD